MTEPQVKRYDLVYSRDRGYRNDAKMVEDAKGDYVLVSDYDALALRLTECEKQTPDPVLRARARQVADEMVKWWWTDYEPSDNWDFNKRNFEEELFVKLSKILDTTAADARSEVIELIQSRMETGQHLVTYEQNRNRERETIIESIRALQSNMKRISGL